MRFIAAALVFSSLAAGAAEDPSIMLATRDHFVPHASTVAANAGQLVGIHVREKARARARGPARVVLFVHGATVPAVPDFDLDYKT